MKKVIITIFCLSVFFISFLPNKDTDFGWHYRCGKMVFKNPKICLDNNFSYYLPEYKSYNPHFFYDIILSVIYDNFGFNGLSVFYGIIITLCALIFLKIIKSFYLSIPFFYLIFFLSFNVFELGLRSQIFTYFFFLISLFLIEKSKDNKNLLFLYPLLTFVWVNTHIGFFIGLIVLFFYLIVNIKNNNAKVIFLIFLLSLLSSIINPFGINVYKEILQHATAPLNQMIAEWVAPVLEQKILIVLLTLIFIIISFKQKKFFLFSLIIILFFAFLSLQANRNLCFFYSSFFYGISFHLLPYIKKYISSIKALNNILIVFLSVLTIFFVIINLPYTLKFHKDWKVYCQQGLTKYPCQAIEKYPSISGNVFAMYEWGGFLIWQKPEIKVFVDGRMPAWKDKDGKSPYQVFLEIIQTQPKWNEKLKKWGTDYLLISSGSFLDLLLQKNSQKFNWKESYRDLNAVIYKKIN